MASHGLGSGGEVALQSLILQKTPNIILILASFALFLLCVALLLHEYQRFSRRLPGISGPPGLPLFGNLRQLRPDPSETCRQWALRYGGIYQISMGNVPVVVFNSMQAAKDVFGTQGSALVDRPRFYTFHGVLSSRAASIGMTPWGESVKRSRKAAATAMNRPSTASYVPLIDELTHDLILDFLERGSHGAKAFSPKPFIQRSVLDLTMSVNYGVRLPKDEKLFDEIAYVEETVSRFRAATGSDEDFVPILRYIPFRSNLREAREINRRRLSYLDRFNRELEGRVQDEKDRPCIQGNVLKDAEAKLNATELMTISMSMISGGLDTVSHTLGWTVGVLATRPDIQQAAYDAICNVYGSDNYAEWTRSAEEENAVPYITALVKECLRYSSILRLSLPRTAWKDIDYEGAHIPKGTTIYLNTWACNRDKDYFGPDVDEFRPERYTEGEDDGTSASRLDHAAYGFGTRMCAGFHLANRQLYIVLLRILWAFKIEVDSERPDADTWRLHPLKDSTEPFHLAAIPPAYGVKFVPRNLAPLLTALNNEKK